MGGKGVGGKGVVVGRVVAAQLDDGANGFGLTVSASSGASSATASADGSATWSAAGSEVVMGG